MSEITVQFTIQAGFLARPNNTKKLTCEGMYQPDGSLPTSGIIPGTVLEVFNSGWSSIDTIIFMRFAITDTDLNSGFGRETIELSMIGPCQGHPSRAAINSNGIILEHYESVTSGVAKFEFNIDPTWTLQKGDPNAADWENPKGPFQGTRPNFEDYSDPCAPKIPEGPWSIWPPNHAGSVGGGG